MFVEVENEGCCFESRGGLYKGDSYGVDVGNEEADRGIGMGRERVARAEDGGPVSKEVGIEGEERGMQMGLVCEDCRLKWLENMLIEL